MGRKSRLNKQGRSIPAPAGSAGRSAGKAPAQPVARWRTWGAPTAVLLVATLTAYWPVAHAGFVFDDEALVIDNPCITANDGLFRIWLTDDNYEYLPLTYSGFWLEHRLWGINPLGYHLVSVGLHAVNALLLWLLLRRLGVPGAWWGAMLFAVHPVAASSVAWISEQKNLWGLLFALASLLLYLEFRESGRSRWYVLSVASFIAALLGKTSVVMLPCLVLAYEWHRAGTLRIKDVIRAAPFFLASLILGLVTVWFQIHRGIAGDPIPIGNYLERLAAAGYVAWFYLDKALAPLQLSMIYPQWDYSRIWWLPVAALVALLALLWRYRRSWNWGQACLLALGCYLLILLPVLGFVPMSFMRFSLVADHFQYPALPVLTALAGAVAVWATGRRRAALFVAGTVAAAFVFLSMQQAEIYRSEETLWLETIRQNPKAWVACSNLGKILRDRGDTKGAEEYLAAGIRLKPDDLNLRLLHANELFKQRNLAVAAAEYRAAIQIKPDDFRAYNCLAEILLRQGRADEAIVYAQAAVALRPDAAPPHFNLAWSLNELTSKRPAEAAQQAQEALNIDPGFAEAHYQLAIARLSLDDATGAEAEFRLTLRLDSTNVLAHNNLASILNGRRQPLEAAEHARAALAITPDLPQAHFILGNAYYQQKMFREAE